jgi:hypothetical protein
MTRALTLSIALTMLAGCGSSDSNPATTSDTGVDPFATSGASGGFGERGAAWARIATAMATRATALGCNLAGATCPLILDTLEQNAGVAGQCLEYDLGTIANCEARIATYASCADFAAKGCQLQLRPSTSSSCPTPDAGSDAAPETAADVGTDAGSETESDSATDAPAEGG